MVIRSGDGMTRSTARPAGINGKMRLDKEIRQLQQTSQMGSLPHRCQTSHKVRENPRLVVAEQAEIEQAVQRATEYWNQHKHPFIWGRRRRHRTPRRLGVAAPPNVALI